MDYWVNLGGGWGETDSQHNFRANETDIYIYIIFALIMEKTAPGLDYHDWKFLKVREHV